MDPKTGQKTRIVVDSDDGIREGVTQESLSKLKPAFGPQGTTHAGNASQITDGAASVLLARRSVAERLGLPILGKFVTIGLAGVKVDVMGIGPAFAIPKALKNAGLTDSDIDFYEINGAFSREAHPYPASRFWALIFSFPVQRHSLRRQHTVCVNLKSTPPKSTQSAVPLRSGKSNKARFHPLLLAAHPHLPHIDTRSDAPVPVKS